MGLCGGRAHTDHLTAGLAKADEPALVVRQTTTAWLPKSGDALLAHSLQQMVPPARGRGGCRERTKWCRPTDRPFLPTYQGWTRSSSLPCETSGSQGSRCGAVVQGPRQATRGETRRAAKAWPDLALSTHFAGHGNGVERKISSAPLPQRRGKCCGDQKRDASELESPKHQTNAHREGSSSYA